MTFGRAILGDNQFLGVNHANQAKAAELYERFKNPDAILEVIAAAYTAGVRDFMFTTHERYDAVFEEIRRSNLFPRMYYSPCLPYAHKYWNKLSERGLGYLLMSTVGQMNPLPMVPAGLGLLAGRTGGIMHLLTRMETLACKGLPLRGVFLQNLAFDFVMAMELYGVIEDFANAVSRRLGVIPGFVTMNHPKAVETLCDRIGLERPWLCANYNIAGFRMNPSAAACEASFAAHRTHNIAMSILASGRASPSEAVRYVRSKVDDGGVDAILFGSSSEANIRANLAVING
ncbi:hypothetical protein [Sphingomonas sp. RS2018]